MKHRFLTAALLALVAIGVLAAPADNTANHYNPDTGSKQSVPGVVIQQSNDGVTSDPINSTHPLAVTGTVTSTPTGTQDVDGNVAAGAADSGNPVKAGAVYNSTSPSYTTGNRTDLQAGIRGSLKVELFANDSVIGLGSSSNGLSVGGITASGATDTGNPVKIGGPYTNNANQPAVTTGQRVNAQFDPAGNLRTAPQRPTATDILDGYATVTATTGSTTLITVSAGRTWVGFFCASVDGNKAAAATGNGLVNATFLTAGTGPTPAAGTYWGLGTSIGANAATGTVGTNGSNANCSPVLPVVAPAGNSITVNYATTCTNTTACAVHVSATGTMQ